MIKKLEQSDLKPCAEIMMSVYNNEHWQCNWTLNTAMIYLLAGFTLSTNRYTPAPDFYRKNGFSDAEHVLFMYKEIVV